MVDLNKIAAIRERAAQISSVASFATAGITQGKHVDTSISEDEQLRKSSLFAFKSGSAQIRQRIARFLELHDCDPLKNLVSMLKDSNIDDELKAQINQDLLQYIAPKLRAVDMTAQIEANITIEVKRFEVSAPAKDNAPDRYAKKVEDAQSRKVIDV